ncbi:MAG: hypothetical protein WCQ72_04655 [Eubacteriales bacterium]
MMKKVTLLLALALLLASFTACGGTAGNDKTDDTSKTGDNTTAAETTVAETTVYDTIGAHDFGGESFTVLVRNDYEYEIDSDESTGEPVNDAVYGRNNAIEDRYNVSIDIISQPGDWAHREQFISYVTSNILAGDNSYQLISGYLNYMPPTVSEGYYQNILDLPYVNVENPWWTQGFTDNMTIGGQLYFAMGDLQLSMLRNAYCGFFDKPLMEQYNGEGASDNFYQTVINGGWTYDVMLQLASSVTGDLDGDGKYTDADLYGIAMNYMPIRALTTGFHFDYTTRDTDGYPQIALFSEKFVEAYEKVYASIHNDNYFYTDWGRDMFAVDRVLFFYDVLSSTDALRSMTSDYGIIPMPKYEESQEGYRTEVVDSASISLVPITATNTELIGVMLEALNYESYAAVTPAYFDVTLQSKYSRDDGTSQTLELIRNGLWFDFGWVFGGQLNGIIGIMDRTVTANDSNIASFWAKNEDVYKTNLESLLEFYKK